MKVLHLITTLDRAGAEVQLLDLCAALLERGAARPSVAYLKGAGELAGEFLAAGVPVARLDADGAGWPGGILRAWRLLRAERPDVVHTHLFKADLLGWLLARRCGARALVSTKHALDLPLTRDPWRGPGRRAALAAHRVVGISGAVADHVRAALDLPPERLLVIPYGLSAARVPDGDGDAFRRSLGIPPDAPVVLAPARLSPEKGVDVLVQAAALLREQVAGVRVVLLGRGPEEHHLRRLAAALDAEDTVLFAGFLPDPGPAFVAADVVALPSRREGFCLAALEALGAGRPVVASAVGGLPEVLGDAGTLVPPDDAEALAAALADALAAERVAAVRDGSAGVPLRERARTRFSMDRAAEAHEALYADALGIPVPAAAPSAAPARAAPAAGDGGAPVHLPRSRHGAVRLLIVSRPGTGGAARHVRLLVERLDRSRFAPVCALSPLESPEYLTSIEDLGVPVIPLPMERGPDLVPDLAAFRAVRRLVLSGQFDLVHAHTTKPGAFARAGTAAAGAPPILYTPHGWYFSYAPSVAARALYLTVERRLATRAARIHCVGEAEAATALRERICDGDLLRVIPNAVPAPPPAAPGRIAGLRAGLRIPEGAPVVLMAARLAEPKRPADFLALAERLGAETGAVFLLAGDGPLLEASVAGAGPHARVLGARDDVPDLLRLADVALLCTGFEACPYFLLEAAAAGRPVAAPRLAVPGDLLHAAIPWDDPADLDTAAAALGYLLTGPDAAERRATLGAAARAAWVRRFSPDPWIDAIQGMYDEVLAAVPPRR